MKYISYWDKTDDFKFLRACSLELWSSSEVDQVLQTKARQDQGELSKGNHARIREHPPCDCILVGNHLHRTSTFRIHRDPLAASLTHLGTTWTAPNKRQVSDENIQQRYRYYGSYNRRKDRVKK